MMNEPTRREAMRRKHLLTLRLRDHEKEQVERAAELSRMTVTELHRDALLKRAKHILTQAGEPA